MLRKKFTPRDTMIVTRYTEKEKQLIRSRAETRGLSTSDYIRELTLSQTPQTMRDMIENLSKCLSQCETVIEYMVLVKKELSKQIEAEINDDYIDMSVQNLIEATVELIEDVRKQSKIVQQMYRTF